MSYLLLVLHLTLAIYGMENGYLPRQSPKNQVRYLGTIKNARGQVVYHVVTKFQTIQAATTVHGHSTVCFLNTQSIEVAKYDVGEPTNLPIKLITNTLYFSQEANRKGYSQLIGSSVPSMLCVAPNDCYSKE